MSTVWDPERKLFLVQPDPPATLIRTIADEIPKDWHQCFFYSSEAIPNTLGHRWLRCPNLAGPGSAVCYCIVHADQKTNVTKAPTPAISLGYCRYGACMERTDDHYCPTHKGIVPEPTSVEDCDCEGYCSVHFNQPDDLEWAGVVEDIDTDGAAKIGWGQLKYRRGRKLHVQAQETVHFKLELRGQRDSLDLFHAMLHLCDTDYPLDPFRKITVVPEQCKNCGGYIWKNAIVTPADIKRAAKQANINVKVRTYLMESTCKKKERVATA